MGRSLKKGPFVDEKLYMKVMAQTEAGTKRPIQTWARALHDCSGICRAYVQGA